MTDDIQRSLGRIEGKLDLMLETQKEHGGRLDTLDAIKNSGYGVLAVVATMGGAVGAWAKTAFAALFHSGS